MQNMGLSRILVVVGALLLTVQNSAQAQSRVAPPSLKRPNRPAVSPYLNLAAAGGNPEAVAFQYYNRVLPDASFRKAANQGAQRLRELDSKIEQQKKMLLQSETSSLTVTGHRTQFMNYGSYFPNKK